MMSLHIACLLAKVVGACTVCQHDQPMIGLVVVCVDVTMAMHVDKKTRLTVGTFRSGTDFQRRPTLLIN